jgi:hypothetical protein
LGLFPLPGFFFLLLTAGDFCRGWPYHPIQIIPETFSLEIIAGAVLAGSGGNPEG